MPKKETEKKRSKRAFDLPRGNLWTADPDDDLVLPEKGHPMYDPRCELPLDEPTVLSIMADGVVANVVVRKEEGRPVVIDGNRRVMHAREANRRLRAQGVKRDGLVRVPIIVRTVNDVQATILKRTMNNLRLNDDLLTKAKNAREDIERNVPEDAVARSFGVGVPALRQWLALAELHPKVQAMVAVDHTLRLQDAVRGLKDVPYDTQLAVASTLAVARPTRATRKANGERQTAAAGSTPSARLKKLTADEAWVQLNEREQTLVGWIRGGASLGQLAEMYPRLAAKLG